MCVSSARGGLFFLAFFFFFLFIHGIKKPSREGLSDLKGVWDAIGRHM